MKLMGWAALASDHCDGHKVLAPLNLEAENIFGKENGHSEAKLPGEAH